MGKKKAAAPVAIGPAPVDQELERLGELVDLLKRIKSEHPAAMERVMDYIGKRFGKQPEPEDGGVFNWKTYSLKNVVT